jgi:hypothetical protein
MGAGIKEILHDYLLSFGKDFADNVTESSINAVKFIVEQLNAILNGKIEDISNFQSNIENYFLKEIGLSRNELELLKERLTK